MKTNKDFNLSKSSKRILSNMRGESRGHWKKMMIEAEVAEKRAKAAKLSGMKSQSNTGDE
jgi:hypothetical protein